MRRPWLLVTVLLASMVPLRASEADAIAISWNIQIRHSPYGGLIDPILASQDSDEITGYTRCGDSALWTGHYLAAESYRYAVTHDPYALQFIKKALWGIQALIDVTGTDVLARCAVPTDSPYASGITSEEASNGVYVGNFDGRPHYWIGNTSRDQYIGAYFGLTTAYEMVDDAEVRNWAHWLVTRLTDHLLHDNWNVNIPHHGASTTFNGRSDQQLSILQISRRINPDRFQSKYRSTALYSAFTVPVPIGVDVFDPRSSYFKFNLDVLSLFSLIHLDSGSSYKDIYWKAYDILRNTVDGHQNAHFNMIDRALRGADEARDAETVQLLELWLKRPRRDFQIDLRGQVLQCGDQACDPIPVDQRVNTDFLWQRSPWQLTGGGVGLIETAGVDYILPYWMARYYGILND